MNSQAISVRNISKMYHLGTINRRTLADEIRYGWLKLRGKDPVAHMGKIGAKAKDRNPEFWALRDVSFDVQPGEVVGVIGRNGAGKSTLLKILTRITEPTAGEAVINGRVGSLLEVGTGFHPELTGRENVYMNGTILGMKKREIAAKFEEIVAFSEIEKFIDTPVKRYSSGMYVRLAFAVAAHLEPEILLVDEVLAVGDVSFQKKCLGKMEDVAKQGRTVLFVSHNMAAVQNLCQRVILLQNGRLVAVGSQLEIISAYLGAVGDKSGQLRNRADRTGTGEVRVCEIELVDRDGRTIESAICGQEVGIRLYFSRLDTALWSRLCASIMVKTQFDVPVFLHHNRLTRQEFGVLPKHGYFELRIGRLPLSPGKYSITYGLINDGKCIDKIENAMELAINRGDYYGSGEVPPETHGVCLVDGSWKMESTSNSFGRNGET